MIHIPSRRESFNSEVSCFCSKDSFLGRYEQCLPILLMRSIPKTNQSVIPPKSTLGNKWVYYSQSSGGGLLIGAWVNPKHLCLTQWWLPRGCIDGAPTLHQPSSAFILQYICRPRARVQSGKNYMAGGSGCKLRRGSNDPLYPSFSGERSTVFRLMLKASWKQAQLIWWNSGCFVQSTTILSWNSGLLVG